MSILVVSDLHIGDFRAERSFKQIAKMLTEEVYDSLVLNGDIFDLWLENDYNIFGGYALTKLINEIAKTKKVVWIIGNHDHEYNKVRHILSNASVADKLKFMAGNKRICIVHGNQVYPFKNLGWHSKVLTRINAWISKVFKIDLQNMYNKSWFYKRSVAKYRKKIVEQLGEKADYVISGHTHLVGTCYHNGVKLYDAGSTAFTRTYAIIDNDGNVCLRRYK